ncbi:MAG: hypothetical protein H7Z10_05955 [Gemmatimonadaceae bacterium]|nr:hypothetical protein [Acetobacteraceae bacterium]
MRRLIGMAMLAGFVAAPAAAQAPNPSFNIVNRGTSPISEVFATPSGQTTWGRDRLGDRTVAPGQNAPVRLPADGQCVYDIRVVFANGQTDERRRLNTCNLDNVIAPQQGAAPGARAPASSGRQAADDPSFRLVNRGRSAVNELYASLTGEDGWGSDRLGEDTVAPGATRLVRLPNGPCTYDVRIVYANGEATEKRRLNLCTMTDMRVP